MVITDKLRDSMGVGWCQMLSKFIESKEMDKIALHIKDRAKSNRICPKSADMWNAFRLCPPEKVRVIIAGISPYHTYTEKVPNGVPVADGLALSCSITKRLQPSLEQIYTCLEPQYNGGMMNPHAVTDPSLEDWAKQGVLLYNVALTVEEGKPCSMNSVWEPFNKYFWEEVVNQYMKGVVIILLGTEAHRSEQYINPLLHYTFKLSHPASAARNNEQWSDNGVWKQMDKILEQNNGYSIVWMPNLPF